MECDKGLNRKDSITFTLTTDVLSILGLVVVGIVICILLICLPNSKKERLWNCVLTYLSKTNVEHIDPPVEWNRIRNAVSLPTIIVHPVSRSVIN